MMRILYHHRTLGDGAEGIHIREMIKAFRQEGHEVILAGPVGETAPAPGNQESALARVKRILPKVVFEFAEIGYSFFCLWEMSGKIRKNRPDFIYDRYITFNFGALLAARLHNVPYVLEVNAPLAHERSTEPDEQLFLKKIAFWVEKVVCSKADHTIVVSTPLKGYLESIGVPKGKCLVMPNGVDPEKFKSRPKSAELIESIGIAPGDIVVGFTGILRPWHGVEMLVDAVCALKKSGQKVFLLIVGDGPLREQIEQLLKNSELKACSFVTRRIAHEAIPNYVNLFDVAVSPKATFYASPMKVVEYMALGKTVLAPDSPNLRDMVAHMETGLLFETNSLQSLTEQLVKAMESPELRGALGTRGAEKVATRLNWGWNAREVVAMIGDKNRQEKLAFSRER